MEFNDLKSFIKDVPDFPKPGIVFKDLAPLLAVPEAVKAATALLVKPLDRKEVDVVVGIESRGFLFGMLMAQRLEARFVMMRKPGKLPGSLAYEEYQLEYGTDQLEMQLDAIKPGDRVIIHDDVLATGGTAAAAARLVDKCGGQVTTMSFLVELESLNGRAALGDVGCQSVIKF
ncbi:MAG: adenine phosphoribosyltransferase [Nonlabens sp.]